MAERKLEAVITLDDKFSRKAQKIGGMTDTLRSRFTDLGKAGIAAAGVIGTAAVVGVGKLGKTALETAADFETMRVALKTAFQGNADAAKEAEKRIVDFTANTPFELEEVMKGFIKLKNLGLDPSEEALRSYGNTASGLSVPLNQMIEAVADAATGEFERLKEFGIRAKTEGDRVKFTFQGVTTEVGNNAEEIEQYLLDIGNTKFAGGIEEQSKTLSGLISTLKDSFNIAMVQMAEDSGLLDLAKKAVEVLIPFVNKAAESLRTWFSDVGPKFSAYIESIKPDLMELWEIFKIGIQELKNMNGGLDDDLIPSLIEFAKQAIPQVIAAFKIAIPVMVQVIGVIGKMISSLVKVSIAWERMKFNVITSAAQITARVAASFNHLRNVVISIPQTITAVFNRMVSSIRNAMNRAVNIVRGKVNQIKGTISDATGGLVNLNRGGQVGSFGNVRKFAAGGIVPGTGNTDSVPAMLRPGEIVINPNRGQTMGNTFNNTFNISGVENPKQIAEMVTRELSRQVELTDLGAF